MSDERIFKQMKDVLHDYQPAVDESVYSGMRRKLWWSNFTKLSFHRFNIYYLIVLLLGASTAAVLCNNSAKAERANTHQHEVMNSLQIPIVAGTGDNILGSASSQSVEAKPCSAITSTASKKNSNYCGSTSSNFSTNSNIQNTQNQTVAEATENLSSSTNVVEGQVENEVVGVTPMESTDLTEKNVEAKDPHLGQKAWKVTVKRDGEKPKKKKEN